MNLTVEARRWPPTRDGVAIFIRGWRCAAPWWGIVRRPWLLPIALWRTSTVLGFRPMVER